MIPRLVRSLFLLLSITFTSAGPTGECLPVGDGGDNYHCIASKDVDVTPCKNEESECDKWALDGECRSNPRYMLFNCRKACETCIGLHVGITQICPRESDIHRMVKYLVETQQYVYDEASVRTSTFKECINRDPKCTQWAMDGMCQRDPVQMKEKCPAACRMCK